MVSKKIVLFGAYPKDTDKKRVIWELVSKREPKISWLLGKNGELKKENFESIYNQFNQVSLQEVEKIVLFPKIVV